MSLQKYFRVVVVMLKALRGIPKNHIFNTSDTSGTLNIKRLSISVTALPADQSWTITLTFDSVTAYQIAVEVQK